MYISVTERVITKVIQTIYMSKEWECAELVTLDLVNCRLPFRMSLDAIQYYIEWVWE